MGCEQSTPVEGRDDPVSRRKIENLQGVGQTERRIGKAQRTSMNYASKAVSGGDGASKAPLKLDERGFLVPEEVAKRTFSSICNKEVTLGTMSNVTHCQFAHWTQRGYYPDDPHKQNQDEFGAHLEFAGVERDAMFAVYDGHGKTGHSCAKFAKDRLPKVIAKHVRKSRCQKYNKSRQGKKGPWDPNNWPLLTRTEYEACCRKAFLEVNQAMHDAPDVVDKLSGTTATSINFHGNFASICNVGDSRVVLGHRVKRTGGGIAIHHSSARGSTGEEEKSNMDDEYERQGRSVVASPVVAPGGTFDRRHREVPGTELLAIPLSKDQTPYRKDERERVKRQGAQIMSIDQMQGKEEMHEDWGDLVLGETLDLEGDSPRVWAKGKDYPGCAFTRSLGDSMSESIGVTAMPEIMSTELTQNDEYLVVASDGIFEFLTNQAVVDMCAVSESPLMACERIVKAAYQQWLTYENRTDDITIIVCFLQNFKPPQATSNKGTTEELVGLMATIYGKRSARMPPPPESAHVLMQRAKRSAPDEEVETDEGAFAYASQEAQATIIQPPLPHRAHTNTLPTKMLDDDEEEDSVAGAEDLLASIIQSNKPSTATFAEKHSLSPEYSDGSRDSIQV